LWDAAVSTIGKQQAARQFASVFWSDLFPEGEQAQRKLGLEFQKAADAKQLTQFFKDHPEYEARMALQNWDDPEAMMRNFIKSSIWDAYYKLSPLEQREAKEQLINPDMFQTSFMNRETRNYDDIDTQTLVQWARQLNGVVPENAPLTPQASALQLPEAPVNDAYTTYQAWQKEQPGYALSNLLYSLPEGMQGNFKLQHPEVQQYLEQRYIFMSQHPELLPYLIGEDNVLAGKPIELQEEVYDYRAAKATLYPMVDLTNAMYWTLPKNEQRKFLLEHPELKEYWDWTKEAANMLSAEAFMVIKGEGGLNKLRFGKAYEAPYYVDYSKFGQELTVALAQNTMNGRALGSGAHATLHAIWEGEDTNMTYDQWLKIVLDAFKL
jgi:hypothetical protein